MSPFDKARYARLLEGLEIQEVNLGALENEMTIGSEYYAPMYAVPIARLTSSPYKCVPLSQICSVITDGDHGSAAYADDGVPFILSEAVEEGWINKFKCRLITPAHASTLPRSTLKNGDVLVTKTGVYFGKSAVVDESFSGANTIAHVGILRLRSTASIDSYYLSTFLNSRYGQAQLRRRGIKATRPEIKLLEFADILVPTVSARLQERVEQVVLAAQGERNNAKRFLDEATGTLLRTLGLDRWQATESLTYTRRASEAFVAGRLDAEYFNPSTGAILERLADLGSYPLSKVAQIGTGFPWKSSFFMEDRSQSGEPFVRIRDCKPGDLEPDDLDRLEPGYANAQGQNRANKGDLVLGMDGLKWFYASLLTGPCYVNQRVAHIRLYEDVKISPEFLLVYLNSLLGQRQLLRAMTIAHTVGHITLEDVRSLLIPNVGQTVHDEITTAVQLAHAARHQAHALLDAAKRAVEIAIEQDQQSALAYLEAFV